MQTAILTLHVIVCLVLIVLVLLQAGREGMGVIFGGGGNSSVFGSSGAGGVLVKLTTFLAVLFIVTSLGYNIITSSSRNKGSSILNVQFEEEVAPQVAPQTAAPATPVQDKPATQESAAPSAPATDNATAPAASSSPATPSSTTETPAS